MYSCMGDVVFSQQLFSSVKPAMELTNFMNREDVKDSIECDQRPFDTNFNDTKKVVDNIVEKRSLDVNDFDENLWNMLFRVEQFTYKRASRENESVSIAEAEADGIRDKVMPTELMQLLMDNGYINIDQIGLYAKKYQKQNNGPLRYLFSKTDFKMKNIPEKPNSQELGGNLKPKKSEIDHIYSSYYMLGVSLLMILMLSVLHISPYAIF